ncbi:hypothetical protein CCACVL1_12682 [Corchorus capsularis]|uniref:Uncharacterized protein n=1 Tax=Corchorus capsularis TaxID=210143 RepID=A0A1R3IEE8_COCAP|nr:hypothetical protein CCACVL1_12682 [Corchorus capsularis]
MKDRGKAVEVISNNNIDMFQDYCSSSDLQCKKHPQSSSGGICAYCLKDSLVKLVCSDCGEQRLSSCSCSDEISSNSNPRTSCTGGEVGSVGRVSFLIENENKDQLLLNNNNPTSSTSNSKAKSNNGDKSDQEQVLFLKRSSSSCVEIKKKNGFWRIGRFFRKKKIDKEMNCGKSVGGIEEKNDLWVVDYMGVSRSRSLCSFRGNGFFGSEDGGDLMNFSGARSSISAARRSSSVCFDPERKSGFSEAEPRKSGFDSERRDSSASFMDSDIADMRNRRVFSLKESYFTGGDDSGFIDLKFDFQTSESKNSHSAFGSTKGGDFLLPHESGGGGGGGGGSIQNQNGFVGDGAFYHGGSCRITVNERGIKKSRKSFKGWRWIFKHHPNWSNTRKKDEHLMFNH